MTLNIYTSYTNTPLPLYNQPNCMGWNSPSLFFNGGYMPPMMGGCCHHCGHGGDDGLGKALLIGAGVGLGVGLIAAFAKPIGKGLAAIGKGIWKGIKWTGKAIGTAAKAVWKGVKWTGKKIGQGVKWLWNNTLGRLFKKKNKTKATTES